MFNVKLSLLKIFKVIGISIIGVFIFFSIFVYMVQTIQQDKDAFSSFVVKDDETMQENIALLKKFGYKNPNVTLIEDNIECVGYEKIQDGKKDILFKNKNDACINLTMDPANFLDSIKDRILLFVITALIFLFVLSYNNKYIYYEITPGFSETSEIIEALEMLGRRAIQRDTDKEIEKFNYMNEKDVSLIKDQLFLTSYILIKMSKEYYKVNEVYTRIIEFFNAKHLFFLSQEFYVQKAILEGHFMNTIGRKGKFLSNRFFYILSLYNTSVFQLFIFVAFYLLFNGIIMSVIHSGAGIESYSLLHYIYETTSIADNLGGDIDLKFSNLSMVFGLFLQITGVALFGIMVTVVGGKGTSK